MATAREVLTDLSLSICSQILLIYDCLDELGTIPAAYADLVTYLRKLLAEHAVILMIDSIDQLTSENLARSNLSFVRSVKAHRGASLSRRYLMRRMQVEMELLLWL